VGRDSIQVELVQVYYQRQQEAVAPGYLGRGSTTGGQKELGNRSDPGLREWHRDRSEERAVVDEVEQYNHVRLRCETVHP
jgi:hypothetical protein